MKNPYKTRQPNNDEVVGYLAYERAMKDAIKVVKSVKTDSIFPTDVYTGQSSRADIKEIEDYNKGFEAAKKSIIAALKSEDNKPITKLSWERW